VPRKKLDDTEARIAEAKKTLKAGGLLDLWYFCTRILRLDFKEEVHGDICAALQRGDSAEIEEILIMLPRGHFKSTLIAAYLAWRIVRNRNFRGIVVAASDDNANKTVFQTRQFLELPLVVELYGDFKTANWALGEFIVSGRTQALRDPTLTARGRKNHRPGPHLDVLVFDDFEDDLTTATLDLIESGRRMDENSTPMVDEPGALRITAGTYWSDSDLHCHKEQKFGLMEEIIAEDGRIVRKRVNGVVKNKVAYFYKPLYNADGSILFPERFPPEKIASIRMSMTPSTFAKQYLLDPVHRETAAFRDEDFTVGPCPFTKYSTIIGLDLANTVGQDSARTGRVVLFVNPEFRIHIADAKGTKMDGDEQMDMIWQDQQIWDHPTFAIEEENYVRGWKIAFEEQQKQKREWLRIEYINAHGRKAKEERILGLQGLFRSGLVTLSPGCHDLIHELLRFPVGQYRDVADALVNAVEIARSPRFSASKVDVDHKITVTPAVKTLMRKYSPRQLNRRMTTDPKKSLAH
jgi:hypothetical protein